LSPKTLTISDWYGNCTTHNRRALQRVVRSAQRIIGGKLLALQDTYSTRCHLKAKKITTTRATAYSTCYRREGEVSTSASKLRQTEK
jgi:hypothetical protein